MMTAQRKFSFSPFSLTQLLYCRSVFRSEGLESCDCFNITMSIIRNILSNSKVTRTKVSCPWKYKIVREWGIFFVLVCFGNQTFPWKTKPFCRT